MPVIILTSEHYTNKIPTELNLRIPNKLLATHYAYDIGTKEIYEFLRKKLNCYSQHALVSRLVIDHNRSEKHKSIFSKYTQDIALEKKQQIITKYYQPYREKLSRYIQSKIKKNWVIHISVHSFTPVLNDEIRTADIGLLYDPKRAHEKQFCQLWKDYINLQSGYRVRSNYPYKGINDGLTTWLRKKFQNNYIGIELELNQKLLVDKQHMADLKKLVLLTLTQTMQSFV